MPEQNHARHSVVLSETILNVSTAEPIQFIDLTDRINQHLTENAVENGTVTVFRGIRRQRSKLTRRRIF